MGIDFGFRGTSEILVGHLEKLPDHNKFIIDHSMILEEDLPGRTMEQIRNIYSQFRRDRIVFTRTDERMGGLSNGYYNEWDALRDILGDSVRVSARWKAKQFEKCRGYNILIDNPLVPPDRLRVFQGCLDLALSLAVDYLDKQKPQPIRFELI